MKGDSIRIQNSYEARTLLTSHDGSLASSLQRSLLAHFFFSFLFFSPYSFTPHLPYLGWAAYLGIQLIRACVISATVIWIQTLEIYVLLFITNICCLPLSLVRPSISRPNTTRVIQNVNIPPHFELPTIYDMKIELLSGKRSHWKVPFPNIKQPVILTTDENRNSCEDFNFGFQLSRLKEILLLGSVSRDDFTPAWVMKNPVIFW